MKKLSSLLVGMLLVASVANAEALSIRDYLEKAPALKQGVGFSLIDNKLNYLSTIELASWKNFNLEFGYAGAAEETKHKVVLATSYEVLKLRDLGVTLPILDLVELNVGMYAGIGHIQVNDGLGDNSNEFDAGFSFTALSFKY